MQKCLFPMKYLRITQGYGRDLNGNVDYTSYSHTGSYALDLGGESGATNDYIYAPCDVIVKRHYRGNSGYNAVWFQTIEPVICADGNIKNLVFLMIHANDNTISSLGIQPGKEFKQGEIIYREGTGGGVAAHVHIEVGEGPFSGSGWYQSQYVDSRGAQVWIINNPLIPHNIFFVDKSTSILDGNNYPWKTIEKEKVNYKILDVSYYQPEIFYEKVVKEIDGVILRCGITYWGAQEIATDSCFEKHYEGFNKFNIPIGVYYYSAADSVEFAEKEADYVLNLIKNKKLKLPVYFDVENNERQGQLSKETLTSIVDTFCSKIQNAGYYAGYYSYSFWIKNKLNYEYLNSKFTLWKANYEISSPEEDNIPCDMWQYSRTEEISGIDKNIDLSICYKDFPNLIDNNNIGIVLGHNYNIDIGPASSGDLNTLKKLSVDLKYSISEEGIFSFKNILCTQKIKDIVNEANTLLLPIVYKEVYLVNKLKIGPMSSGDLNTIISLLKTLVIDYEVIDNSYIITKVAPTGADRTNILNKATSLGIDCIDIEEDNEESKEDNKEENDITTSNQLEEVLAAVSQLKEERDLYFQELENLKKNFDNLNQQYEKLVLENNDLKEKNSSLEKEIDDLKNNNKEESNSLQSILDNILNIIKGII